MKQIIIDTYFTKDKIVKLDNGELDYVDITTKNDKSLVGNIYVGRIDKIINKNFVFINIGDEKNGFLDLSDTKENLNVDFENSKKLKIKQGDKILVQVLRDKTTEKGALVTSQINYRGNNIVIFRALTPSVSVSKKIEDDKRLKLKKFGHKIINENFSILFRTSSEAVDLKVLLAEYEELVEKAKKLEALAENQKPPMLLEGENFFLNSIIGLVDDETSIKTNDKSVFNACEDYLSKNSLDNELFFEENVLINYDIQKQIDKLFHKRIWLKSGGFLFIEQTEASVIIDVNTGKNTKTKNRRKLIKETNTEAIKEIAKQIKLRNLSGIIIVDLIDCKTEGDLNEIKQVAFEAFKGDNVNVVGITSLGLLEITRKKSSESLREKNKVDCIVCNGEGKVFDYDYIVNTILCSLIKLNGRSKVVLKANTKIINFIESKYQKMFKDIGKQLSLDICLESIETGRIDYFDFEF